MNSTLLLPSLAVFALSVCGAALAQPKTRNVVVIVSDGLRWQEIFTGADPSLLNVEHGGIWDSEARLRKRFWNEDPGVRRRLLFPFIWDVVAKHGQLFGNQAKNSVARVTNGLAFSYPGYNEMLTGHADPRINSNEFGPNPNITVYEWLNQAPDLHGRVAAFASWRAFSDIFNVQRSQLMLQAGATRVPEGRSGPREELLKQLYEQTSELEPGDVWDAFLQIPLIDYVKTARPRVLFVGYGETDWWAHIGHYDLVLESAHRMDEFVHELWDTMQAIPEYREQTTFIITADHGRGSGLEEWKEHGVKQQGSENIWIAVMGPIRLLAASSRGCLRSRRDRSPRPSPPSSVVTFAPPPPRRPRRYRCCARAKGVAGGGFPCQKPARGRHDEAPHSASRGRLLARRCALRLSGERQTGDGSGLISVEGLELTS